MAEDGTRSATVRFAIGLARAFGSAVLFTLPMLMTMEMWWLGFSMDRLRLVVLLVLTVPLVIALSHFSGFEDTFRWKKQIVDGVVAMCVGFVASTIVLLLFHVIVPGMPGSEVVGKIALQAVPGSMGAVLAQSQLAGGDQPPAEKRTRIGYFGTLALMIAGSLYVDLNVAPTQEIQLLAARMSHAQLLATALLSIGLMHAFVYAVEFKGQQALQPAEGHPGVFLRFTVAGYAGVLVTSALLLWAFGRLDGSAPASATAHVVILSFPGAIGAASARLVI